MNCPICAKECVEVDHNMYKCKHCNHRTTIIPPKNYDGYVEKYQDYFSNPNIILFKYILSKLPEDKLTLIDIGCGNCDWLSYVQKHNPKAKLYGVDLVDHSKEGITFYKGNFLSMSFKDSFNAVTFLQVIEHVENPSDFIKKVYSISDDIVIVSTINDDSLIYKTARLLKKIGIKFVYNRLYYHYHYQHFTNSSLRKLMENNGFDIVEHKNHNYSVKAVDVNIILKAFVWLLFRYPKMGIEQTIVCKKRK